MLILTLSLLQAPAAAGPPPERIDAADWSAAAPMLERRVGPHLAGLLRAARRGGSVAVPAEARRRFIDRSEDGALDVETIDVDGVRRHETLSLDEVALRVADSDVVTVRLTPPAVPDRITEGVQLTAATGAHVAGHRGEGCRLAIIDAGFIGLSPLIVSGVLPAPVAKKNYTSQGFEKSSSHGTAVTEIAHQMAPDAELLLAKVANLSQFKDALKWARKNGADVVNISLGFPGTNFSDGTGPAAKAVKKARQDGVLPVVSAGNAADGHWLGPWADPDVDKFLDFSPGDEGLTLTANAGAVVTVHLVWDDFPSTSIDLDLAVYHVGTPQNPLPPTPQNLMDASTAIQDGAQSPYEVASFVAPFTGNYAAFVNRASGTPAQVALFVSHDVIDGNNVPASSLATPGDSTHALTVGAVSVANWVTGPVELFSSRGPNLNGDPKPELVGPDGTTSSVASHDPFFGTSAAAPHVAGAACVIKSGNPKLNADELEARLMTAALPVPGASPSEAGAGRLNLAFDFVPPVPDPPVFGPASDSTADTVTLVIVPPADPSLPIEFEFDYVGKMGRGGDGRDWATSNTFVDLDLLPDRKYVYRARARDAAPVKNESIVTPDFVIRTRARDPGPPTAKKIKSTSFTMVLDHVDNPSGTEYAITNETDGTWINAKGKPSATPVWRTAAKWGKPVVKKLLPATTYSFRVKARNEKGDETALSGPLGLTTD